MAYNDLLRLVAQAESGNRDYDSRGRVVTSPVGAKGRMQVMDATNLNPGYGVMPAKDDSLEERARVGQDYLAAMVSNYGGDVRKGLAAYNAGPGNVDRALAKASAADDQNWMRYLPKPEETIPYVNKIVAGMSPQSGFMDRAAAAVIPSANAADADIDWGTVQWDVPENQNASNPENIDWSQVTWETENGDPPPMPREGPPPPPTVQSEPTFEQQLRGGVLGRTAQGFVADPLNAGAQLIANGLPRGVTDAINSATQYVNDLPIIGAATKALGIVPATPEQLNQNIRDDEQAYQQARAAVGDDGFDYARLAGNVSSSAPLAAALAPAAGIGLTGAVGTAAASGSLLGALQPVTEGGDFTENKLTQMAIGAGGGALLSGAGNALSRLISPRASTNPQVQQLMAEGVTPTPGQIMGGVARTVEDKAMSLPIVGDAIRSARNRGIEEFNTAALNRVAAPLGEKVTATGREGMRQLDKIISKSYDDVLPKITFRADQQLGQELGSLQQMARSLPDGGSQFDDILRREVISRLTPQGVADGKNFKLIESEIGRLARNYSTTANGGERELGRALTELQTVLRSGLERSNPQAAGELRNINQAYGLYTTLQRAAGGVGAEGGAFTPSQFASAVRAGDSSMRKSRYASGEARMQDLSDAGRAIMNSTVPNSGTADRLLLGGGAAFLSPTTGATLGAASLPYLPVLNRLTASMLARRPQIAPELAGRINGILPAAGAVAVPALNQPN